MRPANAPGYHVGAAGIDYFRYVDDMLAPADVHDAQALQPATAAHGLFLALGILLTLAHGFNLYLFVGTAIWPVIPLLLHGVLSAVAGLVAYVQYRRGMDAHHLALLAIFSTATGIFGAAGALAGFLGTQLFSARAQHFKDWYESIFPSDHLTDAQIIYDRIVEGFDENPRAYGVMPFVDVMRLGSENQKRRALAKMTSRFSPRFAPAFKLALADHSNSIRVQAATAIAKVERDFSTRLERIEMARLRAPENGLLTMALAIFYDDYAFTGILDAELEKTNRQRAIETYKIYLQQEPDSADAWIAIGRLLYRDRQWAEAADWFRHALTRGWRSNSMVLWYFECLFRLAQYGELRQALAQHGRGIVGQEELPKDVREAVHLWVQIT